jgi:hypothetical protein
MFRSIRNLLSLKVILGAIFFAICIFMVLLGLLWSAKTKKIVEIPATALLNIIEAATETVPAPTLVASSPQQTSMPGAEIKIGDYVQVNGTGGDGLRLHATAGMSGEVKYIAIDTEVFIVKEGPIDADGYVWWLLQDPYTNDSVGWGVADYLSIVNNP